MYPAYTQEEARNRKTFLALMWSLSYPGRAYELSANGIEAFHAIADTLLDLETSYYTPHDSLAVYLATTGARALESDSAAYHFYPTLDDAVLAVVETASTGTLTYPDQSAMLIIGCQVGTGARLRLQGPGIAAQETIRIAGIPKEFWLMRAGANRYPRGWDIYLVADAQIIGLPRTTQLMVEE